VTFFISRRGSPVQPALDRKTGRSVVSPLSSWPILMPKEQKAIDDLQNVNG